MRDIHDRLADLEQRVMALEARVGVEPPPKTLQEQDQARAAVNDKPTQDWPVESEHGALTKKENRVRARA